MKRRLTIGAATLTTFALGALLAVLVAGSAAAASPTTAKKKTTTGAAAKPAPSPMGSPGDTTTTTSPGDGFVVVNGSVYAASDHEIIGSSAFPNYTNGAVDNYYSLAYSHVDNSPFAQGTGSPFDTGPIGQTAAAGNTQQPQYADARWPGSSGKAEYGNQGGPYAAAKASDYDASAEATLATNKLSGPNGVKAIAVPKAFNGHLRAALGAWKAKWQSRLGQKPAAPVVPPKPTLPLPKPPAVTTPAGTVTTPAVGGVNVPTPTPVQAPSVPSTPPAPTVPSPTASAPSRQLAADSTPADGESLLSSSTHASLEPGPDKPAKAAKTTTGKTITTTTTKGTADSKPTKSYVLVTTGESSLKRVSLGGGQIVIEGIHVQASIRNDGDGSPSYKAKISVASASIGGIPVTIDQDGVHVAGQGQGIPYQQASDALNNALKQAGVQLYLVAPEVTMNTCGQSGAQSGGGSGTSTGTTTTQTTTGPSGGGDASSCAQPSSCDQSSGGGTGVGATPPPMPGQTDTTSTTASDACGQPTTCDQAGSTGTGTGKTTTAATTTTASPTGPRGGSTTTSTTTTPTTSSCDFGATGSTIGSCSAAGTAGGGTSTTPGMDAGSGSSMSSSDPFGIASGSSNAGEMTVIASGVHVVFTQPVDQAGVPSQHIEHILGEVFVDSLASPADDLGAGSLDLSAAGAAGGSSSCLGGGIKGSGKTAAGGGLSSAGGGSSVGGSAASGSLSSSASGYGTGAQPTSGATTGNSLPVAFASALRKPLWLLLAYLVWQFLVIGTGVSLWHWRKGDEV